MDRSGEFLLLLGVRAGDGEILAVGEHEADVSDDSYISMFEQEGSDSS